VEACSDFWRFKNRHDGKKLQENQTGVFGKAKFEQKDGQQKMSTTKNSSYLKHNINFIKRCSEINITHQEKRKVKLR